MKLNQELLNRIQNEVGNDGSLHPESKPSNWIDLWAWEKQKLWPEVCRRYSEQIIKCTECDGSGEHEINVDGMDAPSADGCMFCEGKGYLEE
jgi:hypothetical protein